jgi:hypothetical protein
MASRDPRIDDYIAKAPAFARPILARIRKAVHAGCPEATETLKWRTPTFEYKGILCGMAAFKAHCVLGFWKASLMKTAPRDRFESIDDVPSEAALVKLVREAAALNEAGVKVPRAKGAPKKPPAAPSYMLTAIGRNKKAKAAYDAFSPSCKREYVEWITDAKTDETRDRRLQTAVAWMAEGKVRNWKYVR